MAGGSGGFTGSFDEFFEPRQTPSQIENPTPEEKLSSITSLILQGFISKMLVDVAEKSLKEDYRASDINQRLHKELARIEYTKKGFILKDKDEIKEINTPGKLGLAVFQILNDVIAQYEYDKANNVKSEEKDYEVGFWGDVTKKLTNNVYGSYYRDQYGDEERGADR